MSNLKTKEEVYVVVDTPKKAKKLKKVLEMFGEETYSEHTIERCLSSKGTIGFNCVDYWYSMVSSRGKKEVSIKELRNILARKHLKEGDVCLFNGTETNYFGIFNEVCDHTFKGQFEVSEYLLDGKKQGAGIFTNFIRYATDEEKELFKEEEKPQELEVGKWYWIERNIKNDKNALVYCKGTGVMTFGFSHSGDYVDDYGDFDVFDNADYKYIEATAEEVVTALKKEAERRGLVAGARTVSLDDGVKFEIGSLNHPVNNLTVSDDNQLWVIVSDGFTGFCIFDNGKWAELLQECNEPKVGDVCKFQYSDEPEFVIGIIEKIDEEGYYRCGGNYYPHAKIVDKDEVIELLFGDKE